MVEYAMLILSKRVTSLSPPCISPGFASVTSPTLVTGTYQLTLSHRADKSKPPRSIIWESNGRANAYAQVVYLHLTHDTGNKILYYKCKGIMLRKRGWG